MLYSAYWIKWVLRGRATDTIDARSTNTCEALMNITSGQGVLHLNW
jgi:hypothetical protein